MELFCVFKTLGHMIGAAGNKRDPLRRADPPKVSAISLLYGGRVFRLRFSDCMMKVMREGDSLFIRDFGGIMREFGMDVIDKLKKHPEYDMLFILDGEEPAIEINGKPVLDKPIIPILVEAKPKLKRGRKKKE